MPLVAFALGAYIAGLYAGFADSFPFVVLAIGVAAAVGWQHGRVVAVAFAALATIGIVAARTSTQRAEQCARDGIHRDPLLVAIEDSASPGAYLRGHVPECDAPVAIAVEEGDAAAGSLISVRGEIGPSQRGVLVQHAVIRVVQPPQPWRRMRAAASRAIDRAFHDDAPLVRALLIADRHDLSRDVQDRFAA